MKHHQLTDELQERALLFASGAMDEAERQEYARHLEEDGCAICRDEVRESEAAAQTLAMMLPQQQPSEVLKRRLMSRVEGAATRSDAPISRRGAFSWGGWAVAVAALVLVAVFLNANVGLREQVQSLGARVSELESQMTSQQQLIALFNSPTTRVETLRGQGPTPQARARIVWDETARRWHVLVANLPAVSNDRSYQLWFLTPDMKVSAMVFNTNTNGTADFEIPIPPEVTMPVGAAVTIEPFGGSTQPSNTNFALLGML